MKNQAKRDIKRAATIIEAAEITGVSQRSVRRVLAGEQENPNVLGVVMELTERKNLLIEEVKRLVPFN